MDLQELIRIRNQLMLQQSLLDLGSYVDTARNTLLGFALGTHYNVRTKDMAKTYDQVDELSQTVAAKFGQLIDEINLEIDRTAESMLPADYEQKFKSLLRLADDVSLVDDRPIPDIVFSRIQNHAVWKYPVMLLGCRNHTLARRCLNNELTYATDADQRFIQQFTMTLSPETRRKVKEYPLVSYDKPEMFLSNGKVDDLRFLDRIDNLLDFSKLPQAQMGFVFSWNFFNFVTLATMEVYLIEIFKLLRPGGVFMFEYNNCDQESAIYEFELGTRTWMPQRRLNELAERVGFEIIEYHDFYESSYAILGKPGELATIKTSPSIGRKKHYGT